LTINAQVNSPFQGLESARGGQRAAGPAVFRPQTHGSATLMTAAGRPQDLPGEGPRPGPTAD
jgi:hypothetical protein